ncbi:valine--tRNA ligase [Phtheirospermum japonicum]|uniref:valine--tRNA ligase n=1 Tax=Phtheirospermum japonicum TaxID=374723 RepID=A0A830C9N8_9LAMI|nr:valine--tRNA ligase [Phtheirospermum japonicum]
MLTENQVRSCSSSKRGNVVGSEGGVKKAEDKTTYSLGYENRRACLEEDSTIQTLVNLFEQGIDIQKNACTPEMLQDTLICWRLMSGYNALWVPGMDHDGFATQVSNLKNEDGTVLRQLWRLGASLDWSNESFNTNEKRSMVLADKNFVRLQAEGFIYRDLHLVDWDSVLRTSSPHIEVHNDEAWFLHFPPDGKYLVLSSSVGLVIIWEYGYDLVWFLDLQWLALMCILVGYEFNSPLIPTVVFVNWKYKLMSGYNALWVPGMDHNGFATQSFNTNEKRSMVLADKNFVRLQEEGFIYREFQHWMCFFQCHQPDDSPLIRPTILSGIMGTRSWVPIRYRNKTQPRELSLVTMLTDSLRVPIDIPCMVYLESIFSAYRALLPTEPSKRSSRHKFKRISHSVGQSIPSGETWMESIVHSLGKLGWKVLFIR